MRSGISKVVKEKRTSFKKRKGKLVLFSIVSGRSRGDVMVCIRIHIWIDIQKIYHDLSNLSLKKNSENPRRGSPTAHLWNSPPQTAVRAEEIHGKKD